MHARKRNPWADRDELGVGVCDVITSANFYDCRLCGLSVVGRSQILGFSIDSSRRPQNTLARDINVKNAVYRHVNDKIVQLKQQISELGF